MALPVGVTMSTEDVRDLQLRALRLAGRGARLQGLHGGLAEHLALLRAEQIERALRAPHVLSADIGIAGGSLDGSVTEQPLDCTDVRSELEQMGGEAVTQRVHRDTFGERTASEGFAQDASHGAACDGAVG